MGLEGIPNLNNSTEMPPVQSEDVSIYTDSLSMLRKQENEYLDKIKSLTLQGKNEEDLEVRGYRFKLSELSEQEAEIRRNLN